MAYDMVKDSFKSILEELTIIQNEIEKKEQLVEKLDKIQSSISFIYISIDESVKVKNDEIDQLREQLIQLNGEEARLESEVAKIELIKINLNAKKSGIIQQQNTLVNQLDSLDQKREELENRFQTIERNNEDAPIERNYPGLYNIYMAIRDRQLLKLIPFGTSFVNFISTITFEKQRVVRNYRKVNKEINYLERDLHNVELHLQENKKESSAIHDILKNVKNDRNGLEEKIIKKGKMLTGKNNIIKYLKEIQTKFALIKNNLLIANECLTAEDIEMKNIIQLVFKAQQKFLELDYF